ncbi:MAG: hypothetical protein KDA61_21085, partial [Planctomycetales bacterium]|nr:hypothetical protein [Planctomycetales bacterium]
HAVAVGAGIGLYLFFLATIACPQVIAQGIADSTPTLPTVDMLQPSLDLSELPQWLAAPRAGRFGRRPIHTDPAPAYFALRPEQWPPQSPIASLQELLAWEPFIADEDGWFASDALRGGYLASRFIWPRDEIVLLEATGHAAVYVNGEPFAGDPYLTRRVALPISLKKGENRLLFHVAAGKLRGQFSRLSRSVFFDFRDSVFPDLTPNESGPRFASVMVVNARSTPLIGAQATAIRAGGRLITATINPIPPLGQRRIVVPIDAELTTAEQRSPAVRVQLDLALPGEDGGLDVVDSTAFDLAVVAEDRLQTRTFVSGIDDSVQSYLLLPAAAAPGGATALAAPGTLAVLHDVGVEPRKLLAEQPALPWAHVVAPLGRRVDDCDWEDFSRRDALEAIADAQRVKPSSDRVAICGQGAGGHGAWRLAALRPDQFCGAASLGGWTDYASYGPATLRTTANAAIAAILDRCGNATSLLPIVENLRLTGVSIQHRLDDPAVPIAQSQAMRSALAAFHGDFSYHELFDESPQAIEGQLAQGSTARQFLRRCLEASPGLVDHVSYASLSLDQGASNRWLTLLQQQRVCELSQAEFGCIGHERRFWGVTRNVRMLSLDVSDFAPGDPVYVIIDGQPSPPIAWPDQSAKKLDFVRIGDRWRYVDDLDPRDKSPRRPGGWRNAFSGPTTLVYGTLGTTAENAWSLAKARFDAQTFWVRAAGAVDVISDIEVKSRDTADQHIVIYGNADTNRAWAQFLSTSPIQVRRDVVRVGRRPELGSDLACLFVQPRSDSDTAVVAAVSGSGLTGMRATDRLPLFVNGVVFPDLLLFDASALTRGEQEIRAVGFLGPDWSVDEGEVAWRDAAL